MKTALKVVSPILCVVALTQCEDVLDTAPMGELSSETFYQTASDFEAASLAPYSTLLNLYYDQFGLGWFQGVLYPDDDVRNPHGGANAQEEFNWRTDNSHFAYLWTQAYKGILRSNMIIDRLPKAQGFTDEEQKARFEAEARFIRAYFYFLLARNFGEVPIVTGLIQNIADSRVGNSQPGEVWDLIEEDLSYAAQNLPESWDNDNTGRATRYAALALLGKANLYRAQWFDQPSEYQEAIQAFNEVVNSGRFRLVDDYGDNFREDRENNAESLFEIQMTRGNFNPWLPVDHVSNEGAAGSGRVIFTGAACGPTNVCAPGANAYGYGQVHVTESLQEEFEEGDPRRGYTFFQEGDVYYQGAEFKAAWSVTGATPAKYVKQSLNLGQFPLNITVNNERVIRYADVLLMLAEAELLGNGNVARAAELVNQVRARARKTYEILNNEAAPRELLPDVPATGAPLEWFRRYLVHERRVELALEVHRYDDLVRWHRAGLVDINDIDFGNTVANSNWTETYLLKPIPQRELEINPNLKQNPGY